MRSQGATFPCFDNTIPTKYGWQYRYLHSLDDNIGTYPSLEDNLCTYLVWMTTNLPSYHITSLQCMTSKCVNVICSQRLSSDKLLLWAKGSVPNFHPQVIAWAVQGKNIEQPSAIPT